MEGKTTSCKPRIFKKTCLLFTNNYSRENNLQQIFQKIIQERGPFRDLKEEDLQKELQKESIKDESSAKSSETENVLEFATLDSKRNVNDTEVESMDSQAYKKELIEQIMYVILFNSSF